MLSLKLLKKLSLLCFTLIIVALENNSYAVCFCGPPTGTATVAAATGVGQTSLTANWAAVTPNCAGLGGYIIDVSLTNFGASLAGYPRTTTTAGTSAALASLTCGTTYYIRVKGYTNTACGTGAALQTAWSPVVAYTTSACAGSSCSDGIQNGTETGIDCGGSCPACVVNCTDGIQNGAETGIDCGGSCPVTCTTNTTPVTSVTGCTTTSAATVYQTHCDQIGTTAYNTNSPNIVLDQANTSVTLPSNINCENYDGTTSAFTTAMSTTFMNLELDAGVQNVNLSEASLTALGSGNSKSYVAAYQGNSCGTVTFVGCYSFVEFESGSYYYNNINFSGLNDAQDLYLYAFNNSAKDFTISYQAVGSNTSAVPNTSCATAEVAGGQGCNLGAPGAGWTAPEAAGAGVDCGGGVWTSNENTTYYSFTADATTGSLEIDGILCNDGGSGAAQFGVWTSCAAVGTYGAGFLGCQVGTAPLSLSPLVDGQTYYIAVDGSGGDNCTWGFSGTGIILPIEYDYLTAEHTGDEVIVNWGTVTESNNAYFTIQRTLDGRSYENIGEVKGAGNSNGRLEYSFIDKNPYFETSFYRIKQTDFDGEYKYSDIRTVNSKMEKMRLIPNPADEETKLNFSVRRAQNVTLKIVDLFGNVVYEQSVQAIKGLNNTVIDLRDFKNGIYTVSLQSNEELTTLKLSVY